MHNGQYPPFSQNHLAWLKGEAAKFAHRPEHVVSVGRREAGIDLELLLDVDPASRDLFTAEVCRQLAQRVTSRTQVRDCIVYEVHSPHEEAQQALIAAAQRGH